MAKTFLVRPGGRLVVEGACLQAAVQDADEPVRQPPQRVVVFDSTGAEVVVKGAGARGCAEGGEGLRREGVDELVIVDQPGGDDFFLPNARVIGLVEA